MAVNTATLKITVKDDGSLAIITKEAKKATKSIDQLSISTDKANRGQNNYNKMQKGTAQLTNNSTKAFSKQAQTIGSGGSTSLVGAYATLAANVFALSALFLALKNAAAFEQLEAGIIRVGNAAGANLPLVASRLRDITGAAISTKVAMSSVAIGTSAGFDTAQLEGLTKVAKGASLALGRDMADAMSRLIRGAAKLEPEILDELGIMVRLDDATETYATTIGKTAAQLSQFERRMAFTNAIITQGTEKFGEIAQAIDPNIYDQLSATFSDVARTGLTLVNKVLEPLISIFAGNGATLAAGVLLFATTITKQMVPGLYKGSQAAAVAAKEYATLAETQLASSLTAQKMPKLYTNSAKAIGENAAKVEVLERQLGKSAERMKNYSGELEDLKAHNIQDTDAINKKIAVMKEEALTYNNLSTALTNQTESAAKNYSDMSKSAALSMKTNKAHLDTLKQARLANNAALKAGTMSLEEYNIAQAKNTADMARKQGLIKVVAVERSNLAKSIYMQTVATIKLTESEAIEAASKGKNLLALKLYKLAIYEHITASNIAVVSLNVQAAAVNRLGLAYKIAALSVKVFGTALLKALPMIGMIAMALSMLWPLLSGLFGKSEIAKAADEAAESFDSFAKISSQLGESISKTDNRTKQYVLGLKATVGVLDQIASAMKAVEMATDEANNKEIKATRAKIAEIQNYLAGQEDDNSYGSVKALKKLNILEAKLQSIMQGFGKFDKTIGKNLVEEAVARIKNSGPLSLAMAKQVDELRNLEAKIASGAISTFAQYKAETDKIAEIPKKSLESIGAAGSLYSQLSKDIVASSAKTQTPIDNITKGFQSLANEAVQSGLDATVGFQAFEDVLPKDFVARMRELFEIQGQKGSNIGEVLLAATEKLQEYQRAIASATVEAKKHKETMKQLKGLTSTLPGAVQQYYAADKLAKQAQVDSLNSQINSNEIINDKTGKSLILERQRDNIIKSMNTKAKQALDMGKARANQEKLMLNLSNKLQASKSAILKLEMKNAKEDKIRSIAKDPTRDNKNLTTEENLAILKTFEDRRLKSVEKEADIKKKSIDMEFTLLELQSNFLVAQAELLGLKYDNTDYLTALGVAKEDAKKLANLTLESKKKEIQLEKELVNIDKTRYEAIIDYVGVQTSITDALQEQATLQSDILKDKLEINRLNAEIVTGTKGLNAKDEAKFASASRALDIQAAKTAYDLKFAIMDAEYSLLDAQVAVMEADLRSKNKEGELTNTQQTLIDKMQEKLVLDKELIGLRQKAAASELAVMRKQADVAPFQEIFGSLESFTGNTYEVLKYMTDTLEGAMQGKKEVLVSSAKEEVSKRTDLGIGNTDAVQEVNTALAIDPATAAADQFNEAYAKMDFGAKMAFLQESTRGMQETLATLGPDGEFASAVVLGAFAITDAWTGVAEAIEAGATGMEKGAAIANAVASTIGQIGAIATASSDQKIAGIDKEIEAEKKRDGKSKDSLAKITALEAKKERMERKAFEQNKKIRMAETVANTAAGVMKAFAQGGMFGFITGALIAAMGAAQLAAIASTSYSGGGSTASVASSVNIGERANTVDLASSTSASGELAFARNETGTGTGMSSFTPAFTGRATGGATTGYMVGEQGPELFIPETPGTIKPADESSMQQPMNVNFSINTIDSSNMEQMLTAQRGGIIRMLREAANQHGDYFMENVREGALT